jgi:16S rRNA processing protein RimM
MTEDPSRRGESESGGFIAIARVTKAQGRKGEVAAVLLTDFPERFATRKRLFLLDRRDQRREVELEDHWFHKGGVVLKFRGVDSISQAEELTGCEVQIPRAERAALEEGSFYVSDLIGCTVSDGEREIGKIEDVQFGAGEAPLLVIKGSGNKEYLVPFAAAYIEKLAPTEKRLEMKLPEGMLELDAPLSCEEKDRQKERI